MWSNLLSGTIGSVIGVVGAVIVAYLTVTKTRQQEAALVRENQRAAAAHAETQRQVETSGNLAYNFVSLYDQLKAIETRGSEPSEADLATLRPLAERLNRSIVVDAPLMPDEIENHMREARKEVATFLTTRDEPLSRNEIIEARAAVKAAGDVLREFRRSDG